MTNKEKIVELLNTYEAYAEEYLISDEIVAFKYGKEKWDIGKEDLETVKEIIKDLEVLEILRKKLSIVIDSDDENDCCKSYEYVAIDTCDSIDEPLFTEDEVEEEKIVMRWLKNE